MRDTLLDCLPPALRGDDTIFTPAGAGMSGAAVHRVARGDETFVLKVARDDEPDSRWRQTLHVLRQAAEAGVAPPVVHVDAARRAVLSRFVGGPPFAAHYRDPATHDAALALLATTLRRVHELPVPAGAPPSQPRVFLAQLAAALGPDVAVPAFVREHVEAVLAMEAPPPPATLALSHNDANPSNLLFDGARLYLADWDVASPGDPYYDLGVVSLFLRMDDATSRRLVALHDGWPVDALPYGVAYFRRLAAAMAGALMLGIARRGGFEGDASVREAEAPALADVYRRMGTGALDARSPAGQWKFGLALVREGRAL